jgi:hypothetical protein
MFPIYSGSAIQQQNIQHRSREEHGDIPAEWSAKQLVSTCRNRRRRACMSHCGKLQWHDHSGSDVHVKLEAVAWWPWFPVSGVSLEHQCGHHSILGGERWCLLACCCSSTEVRHFIEHPLCMNGDGGMLD